MSKASKAILDFREYLNTIPAFTSSATRSEIVSAGLFWDEGARALLEWARSKSTMAYNGMDRLEGIKSECVSLSDLEAYFAEESI